MSSLNESLVGSTTSDLPAQILEPKDLVRLLAVERARRGLTQSEVALRMGTTQPYVARFESAASDPRLSTVFKYASIVLGGLVLAAFLQELGKGGARLPVLGR